MDPSTMKRYLDASIKEARHRSNRVLALLDGRVATERQRLVVEKAERILRATDSL